MCVYVCTCLYKTRLKEQQKAVSVIFQIFISLTAVSVTLLILQHI